MEYKLKERFIKKTVKVYKYNEGRDTYILNDNGGFNRLYMKIFASNGISRLNNK